MHPAPDCKFYLEGKCTRKNCFFKHPPEMKPAESVGPRDGSGRRSGGNNRGESDGRRRSRDDLDGNGNNRERLDVLEATLSSVLEAVQKLTSFQANSLQKNNNLNQWLSQKQD